MTRVEVDLERRRRRRRRQAAGIGDAPARAGRRRRPALAVDHDGAPRGLATRYGGVGRRRTRSDDAERRGQLFGDALDVEEVHVAPAAAPVVAASPGPVHASGQRRAFAARREARADLEEPDVAPAVPAVVADGVDQARAAGSAASRRTSPTADWRARSARRRSAKGAAARASMNAKRDRLREAHGEHRAPRTRASRAMRGSDGGGACCTAGEGRRQMLEAVVAADFLDEVDRRDAMSTRHAGTATSPRRRPRQRSAVEARAPSRMRSTSASGTSMPEQARRCARASSEHVAALWTRGIGVDDAPVARAGADALEQRAGARHRRARGAVEVGAALEAHRRFGAQPERACSWRAPTAA